MSNKFLKYHQAVRDLEAIIKLPIKNYEQKNTGRSFFIERMRFLFNLLGNPHYGFRYIHITGTAGKGTTANLIHEILNSAGYKVGSYFSPHPTTAIERIKVNNLYISPTDFAKLINQLKPVLKKCAQQSPYGHPSYFETFLALAFLYFKKQKCDYVVLEAGLGGRHDATNVIEKPLITMITNINYDHQQILGYSLTKIAKDKAGIIKRGSTFLTTEARPPLLEIFKRRCRKVGAKFIWLKTDGDKNIALAKKTAQILKIPDKFIQSGINKSRLPCRFEIIQQKPLVILDGSHNPAKLTKLVENLKKIKYQRLILLLAMAADKNHAHSLKVIAPLADEIILTKFSNPYRQAATLKKLKTICQKYHKPLQTLQDSWQALAYAQKKQKNNELLLITGSFFLTGELRTKWVPAEDILKHKKSF